MLALKTRQLIWLAFLLIILLSWFGAMAHSESFSGFFTSMSIIAVFLVLCIAFFPITGAAAYLIGASAGAILISAVVVRIAEVGLFVSWGLTQGLGSGLLFGGLISIFLYALKKFEPSLLSK